MEKKMMISQPIEGLTNTQIVENRSKAIQYATDNGYEIISNRITENPYIVFEYREHHSVYYLANVIAMMSECDTAYFCSGFLMSRGCQIVHDVAKAYGLNILYENTNAKE